MHETHHQCLLGSGKKGLQEFRIRADCARIPQVEEFSFLASGFEVGGTGQEKGLKYGPNSLDFGNDLVDIS